MYLIIFYHFRLSLPVSTLEASFDIPLMACDAFVQPPNSSPWMKGFIAFQQHPLVPTIDDFVKPFVCVIRKNTNRSWSEVLEKASYALNDSPNVYSWLDFELLPEISIETELFDPNSSHIFLYVNGVRQFNDMIVTDCIAHRLPYLYGNTSFFQMTDPNGCINIITETLSPFYIMRSNRGLIRGAYSKLNPVSIENLRNGFISCSAVLCKSTCKCTNDSSPIGHEIVFTGKFPSPYISSRSKRSVSEVPSSSNRSYQIRNRFMRSTVKALAERLMKYRRQPRREIQETDFERRVAISEDEETTAMYTDDDSSITFDPTEHFISTEFSTELYPNIEIRKLNRKNLLSVNISTTVIPELEVEKMLTNLVELPTTVNPFPKHTTFNGSFPDNHSMTLTPELELEKKFNLVEQSTTETISNYETTIEHLEESKQKHKDFTSIANVTTETGDLGQKVENETIVAEESHEDPSYCVPKLKFVVVTTVLSFIVVCLILVSCGLVLYLRKENKKHAIDNFLLYNYF